MSDVDAGVEVKLPSIGKGGTIGETGQADQVKPESPEEERARIAKIRSLLTPPAGPKTRTIDDIMASARKRVPEGVTSAETQPAVTPVPEAPTTPKELKEIESDFLQVVYYYPYRERETDPITGRETAFFSKVERATGALTAGTYELQPLVVPASILETSKPTILKVRIPVGYTYYQVFQGAPDVMKAIDEKFRASSFKASHNPLFVTPYRPPVSGILNEEEIRAKTEKYLKDRGYVIIDTDVLPQDLRMKEAQQGLAESEQIRRGFNVFISPQNTENTKLPPEPKPLFEVRQKPDDWRRKGTSKGEVIIARLKEIPPQKTVLIWNPDPKRSSRFFVLETVINLDTSDPKKPPAVILREMKSGEVTQEETPRNLSDFLTEEVRNKMGYPPLKTPRETKKTA